MDDNNIDNILHDFSLALQRNSEIEADINQIDKNIEQRISVCDNTPEILNEATNEFNKLTSIFNKEDIPFFVFSVILQCGVKYLIKVLREMGDKELAKRTPFHKDEHSSRLNSRYYASREEIIASPVPFDAIQKAHNNAWYKENRIKISGFNGFNHRVTALGHDPILGLIFGTANIMTSTITRNDFLSWHVETLGHLRTAKNGNQYTAYLDSINERASTIEIFKTISQRLANEGKEGWITLGCSLLKEIVHLFSDLPSKQSLPIPFMSTFSLELAKELSFYGLNTGTIVQGGLATMIINWGIAFFHRLTKKEEDDEKLFEARTKKIIMYSDLLATTSDIGYSLFLAYMGDKNSMRKFDLGGYLVTLHQISNSSNVISAIERDFYVNKIIDKFNMK